MWRSVFAFSALTLFGAGLTGCALNKFEQREPWRDQTEQACNAKRLVETTEFVTPVKEIERAGRLRHAAALPRHPPRPAAPSP